MTDIAAIYPVCATNSTPVEVVAAWLASEGIDPMNVLTGAFVVQYVDGTFQFHGQWHQPRGWFEQPVSAAPPWYLQGLSRPIDQTFAREFVESRVSSGDAHHYWGVRVYGGVSGDGDV